MKSTVWTGTRATLLLDTRQCMNTTLILTTPGHGSARCWCCPHFSVMVWAFSCWTKYTDTISVSPVLWISQVCFMFYVLWNTVERLMLCNYWLRIHKFLFRLSFMSCIRNAFILQHDPWQSNQTSEACFTSHWQKKMSNNLLLFIYIPTNCTKLSFL